MSQTQVQPTLSKSALRRKRRRDKASTQGASDRNAPPNPVPLSQSKQPPVQSPAIPDEKAEAEEAEAEKALAKRLEGKQLEDEEPVAKQPDAGKAGPEPGPTIRDWYRSEGGDEEAIDKLERLIAAVAKTGVHLRRAGRGVDYPGAPDGWVDPPPSVRGDPLPSFGGAVWLRQVAQERGDMHDIRAALHLRRDYPSDRGLRVIITMQAPQQVTDIRDIVDYYGGFGDRVLLQLGRHEIPNTVLRASQATEILFRATEGGKRDISRDLQDATAASTKGLEGLYDKLLEKTFRLLPAMSLPYALINYRTSGHGSFSKGGRSPSHPELDTGTTGFQQLWQTAVKKGYMPVPTGGDIPKSALDAVGFSPDHDPSLLDYFLATKDLAKEAREQKGIDLPDRMFEYGVFRRIREHFTNAIAIGMRSGGLDAIAFSGIPVVSVDLKTDELDLRGREGLDPEFIEQDYGHHNSWRRAEKRKAILPGTFQQAFMTDLREGAGTSSGEFEGALDDESLHAIGDTIAQGFGSGKKAGKRAEFIDEDAATDKLSRYGEQRKQREERDRRDALRKRLNTPIETGVTGTVARVDSKGFGFIRRADGKRDVYIAAGAITGLRAKMRLRFDIFPGDKGPRAGNVALLPGRH